MAIYKMYIDEPITGVLQLSMNDKRLSKEVIDDLNGYSQSSFLFDYPLDDECFKNTYWMSSEPPEIDYDSVYEE